MELDLGLRITRAIENITCSSTETETVFVLFAHLPGFEKDEIEISINEEGKKISISGGGERSSIETTIPRRLMLATEVIERFQKVFRIPDGVDLDRIDAGFDEENAILIVLIPKLIKGVVSGVEIEEIKRGEDEGGEEGKEASRKEKEQDAKRKGEEASFKDQQVKEYQNGQPELEKERIGMEQKIPEEETEEDRISRVVPDLPVEIHDLDEEPPSSEAPEPKEEEPQKELQIPRAPPTPPVPVETHDFEEVPPISEEEERQKELQIPMVPPTPPVPVETHDLEEVPPISEEGERQKELQIPMAPPTPPVPVEIHDLEEVPPSSKASEPKEAEPQKELPIAMAPDLPPTAQEPIKDLEIDQEQSQEPIRAHPRQEPEQEDLGLGEEVGVERREGNGSEKKGRKKGKRKGLSLPLTPSLTSAAFLLSLAVLAFHYLRSRKK